MASLVCIAGRDPVPSFLSLGEGESLRMTLVVPEGVSIEHSLEIHLDGPGASLDLAGAWRCSSDERVRLQVIVRHNAPDALPGSFSRASWPAAQGPNSTASCMWRPVP